MSDTIKFAKNYAARGWRVFPLRPREKTPVVKWADVATTEENMVLGWWDNDPSANIGIACGKKSGIVVLDVDAGHGGFETLEKLQDEHGRLPVTPVAQTGGGGEHIFFAYPDVEIRNSAGKLGPGLDIRGEGGYVVAAPSVHPSGNEYRWTVLPSQTPLAEMPRWMIDLLKEPAPILPVVSNGLIANGSRNNTLASLAGSMRRKGMDEDTIFVALKSHNEKHCVPPLPDGEVLQIAKSMTRYDHPVFMVQEERKSVLSLKNALSDAYDATDKAAKGEIKCIPTGFVDFDRLLDGGLYAPDSVILAARPGQGKTAFLVNVAYNAAKIGKRVAFFSLEMGNVQVAMRLISMVSGVSFGSQRRGKMKPEEWPLYTHAIEVLQDLPIAICDVAAITQKQMRQKLNDEIIPMLGGVDLLCFDYLQLGGTDNEHGTREQEVSEVSRGTKAIAKDYNCAVLGAAQLSRAVEQRAEKRPVLSDLRESGSLENDADIVAFIYRPDQYEKDSSKQNVAEIIVAKHRNGAVGSIELIFRPTMTKFENAVSKMVSVR